MMKYLVAALVLAQAAAFTTVAPSARTTTHLAAEYEKKEGEGKINLSVRELHGASTSIDDVLVPTYMHRV